MVINCKKRKNCQFIWLFVSRILDGSILVGASSLFRLNSSFFSAFRKVAGLIAGFRFLFGQAGFIRTLLAGGRILCSLVL